MTDSIKKAKQEWDRAERLKAEGEQLAQKSIKHFWAAAKYVSEAIEAGHTTKTIAIEIGRKQRDISDFNRTWKKYGHEVNLADGTHEDGRGFWELVDLSGQAEAMANEIRKRAKEDEQRAKAQGKERRSLKSIRYEMDAEKKAVEKLPEIVRQAPKTKKVEALAALSEDQTAVEAALDDQNIHTRIVKASAKAHEKRALRAEKAHEAATGHNPNKPVVGLLHIWGMLGTASSEIKQATQTLQRHIQLTEVDRAELNSKITELEQELDWLRSVVNGGGMITDAALHKLADG